MKEALLPSQRAPRPAETLRRRALRWGAQALLPPSLMSVRGPADRRCVALTFDDGPEPSTGAYLDALDRLAARATFFVVGRFAEQRRESLLEMVARGHEVAGHGFTHKRFTLMEGDELDGELRRTARALPPAHGRPLVRPPQGATSLVSLLRCARAGYSTVLWSLDSDDCRTDRPDEVAARVSPERVAPGEIVLLHEGQKWTLDALPQIVEELRAADYSLVTVSELLGW